LVATVRECSENDSATTSHVENTGADGQGAAQKSDMAPPDSSHHALHEWLEFVAGLSVVGLGIEAANLLWAGHGVEAPESAITADEDTSLDALDLEAWPRVLRAACRAGGNSLQRVEVGGQRMDGVFVKSVNVQKASSFR